jgi:hypothetical protein
MREDPNPRGPWPARSVASFLAVEEFYCKPLFRGGMLHADGIFLDGTTGPRER